MASYRFRKGLHLHLIGKGEFTIEQRLPNGNLQIKDIATNEYLSIKEEHLIQLLFEDKLQILGDGQDLSRRAHRPSQRFVSDISLLSDSLKQETKRRFAYVNGVVLQGAKKLSKQCLSTLIEEVKKDLNDSSPPSAITLYRWVRQYLASGEDIRSLVPAYKRRGNRNRKFSGSNPERAEATVKIIETVIAERYLTRERPTIDSICDTIIARTASVNEFRSADDQLSIPSKSSIYDIVNKLDRYEVTKARYGERIANHRYGALKQGPRPTRPLERVEIDHTKLDLMIVDPVMRLPVGRPWMTVAIDKYTRMVVGMYTSFHPPSTLSVMQCLRHAIKTKTYVRELYPQIKNTWDAYGIMESVVLDNAPEFYSTDLEDACLQLGILIIYSPPKRGQYKGSVERFFRTQNQQLLHGQPGTTFSNIIEREDYDPKRHAVISADAFHEMIHIFLTDVYHQRRHRGLNDAPARAWTRAIAEFPPALPSQNTDLNVLLGCIEHRTISTSGMELNGLFYNNESLARLRRRIKSGEKITLKYDPSDLSLIHVADKENGVYIAVPALNQDYTQRLTLWQHKVIRRYVREVLRRSIDIVALCLAKEKIQEIVEREWLSTKKTTTRQKLARLKEFGQGGHIEALPPVATISLLTGQANVTHPETIGTWNGVSATGVSFAGNTNNNPHTVTNRGIMLNESIARPSSATEFPIEDGTSQVIPSRKSDAAEPPNISVNSDLDTTGWNGDYDLPK